ncbi:MAG: 50S ribosomal protein L44e [Candidatus Woesearchaeota archaeon]|nr:MAG: 50S ribosomal protein L44e [Candidatus Woesearchaeota archaeon]
MKVKKTINTYCPKCKKHTPHKVSLAKAGGRSKTHPLSRGNIKTRARLRGLGRGHGNLGRWGSKPPITKWKRAGVKTSKKNELKLTCDICKKSTIRQMPRSKKLELV